MTTPSRRVRRPADKEQLVQQLVGDDGPFDTYRDLLGFAAALGFSRNRRESFERSSEPIAWEVFTTGFGNEALVDLIGVVDAGSVEVMATARFEDRLRAFEEYANGGLSALQEAIAAGNGKVRDAVLDLVSLSEGKVSRETDVDLDRIARELTW